MRLTVDPSGHVNISYTCPWLGERVERRFSSPGRVRPGYVIEHLSGGRTSQVCDCLARTGPTLECLSENLPHVIRREYQAMRRELRRTARRAS